MLACMHTPDTAVLTPPPPPPLPLLLQGHYLSATPRVALPWPMQVGVLLVNCMAAELLYRSVVLQVRQGAPGYAVMSVSSLKGSSSAGGFFCN